MSHRAPFGINAENISDNLEAGMQRLAALQEEMDISASSCGYVPQYLIDDYQTLVDEVSAFSASWGMDIGLEEWLAPEC